MANWPDLCVRQANSICVYLIVYFNWLTACKCLESVRRASYLGQLDRMKRKFARRMCSVLNAIS
jgi:hypothetical protein